MGRGPLYPGPIFAWQTILSRGFAANIAWGGSGKGTSGQPLVSVPDPPKTSSISIELLIAYSRMMESREFFFYFYFFRMGCRYLKVQEVPNWLFVCWSVCTTVLTIAFFTRIATVHIVSQDCTARLYLSMSLWQPVMEQQTRVV